MVRWLVLAGIFSLQMGCTGIQDKDTGKNAVKAADRKVSKKQTEAKTKSSKPDAVLLCWQLV